MLTPDAQHKAGNMLKVTDHSFQSWSLTQNCTLSLSSFLILWLDLHLLPLIFHFEVHKFPCWQALVHVPQMKGDLTQVGEVKGSCKCPSQIQRCLIIQALKHFTFLLKTPIRVFWGIVFCSMSKMTTTYFTRWICSEGIVTDATLPRKITFRLSIQILIWNKCFPICRHSPVRCYLLKPTG